MKLFRIECPGSPAYHWLLDPGVIEMTLGDRGEGCKRIVIPIVGKEGKDFFVKDTSQGIVLFRKNEKPWGAEKECLVLIDVFFNDFEKMYYYDIFGIKNLKIIACGLKKYTSKEKTIITPEVLAVIKKGTEFFLPSANGFGWYRWGEEGWSLETTRQRKIRLILEEAKRKKFRWF